MQQTTLIQVNQSDLEEFFAQKAKDVIVEKYAAVEVGVATVCEIWNVSESTVGRYVKENILPPLNPGSSKYRFRLSDVLVCNPKYKHF